MQPWLRGEPLNVPSHALVIHFPAALLPTSLVVDVAAHVDPGLGLGSTGTVLLVLGLLGAVVAAATGLLDWLEMIPGARRDRVTRHMLVQLAAVAVFLLSLALHLADPGTAGGPPLALAISALGVVVLSVGDHFGGLLVYRDAMRVRTGIGRGR